MYASLKYDPITNKIEIPTNRVRIDKIALGTNDISVHPLSFGTSLFTNNTMLCLFESNGSGQYGFGITANSLNIYNNGSIKAAIQEYGIVALNGTSSNPSFSFINDVDCGMYRISSDLIGFSVGGDTIMEIGQGYVTIGLISFNALDGSIDLGNGFSINEFGEPIFGYCYITAINATGGTLYIEGDLWSYLGVTASTYSSGFGFNDGGSVIAGTSIYFDGSDTMSIDVGGNTTAQISSTAFTVVGDLAFSSVSDKNESQTALGIQHKRVSDSVGDTGESFKEITITWDTPFPDTNYTVVVSLIHNSNLVHIEGGNISNKTSSNISLYVVSDDELGPYPFEVDAIAIQD